jgi:hypothetical protein
VTVEHRTTLANGYRPFHAKNGVMTFPELRARVDEQLETEPRLQGSRRELFGENCVWTRGRESVAISASGTTGILVELMSSDRLVRSKIFALSPMMVERIVTTAAEHLTAYAFHRTELPH